MKIDKTDFKAWLSEMKPDEIAGIARECDDCPVARYVNKDYEYPEYMVRKSQIYNVRSCVYINSPEWVFNFVEKIDALDEDEVSVEQALEILEEV